MQKSTLLSAALSAMVALGIGLTSCKDDDDPFVPPTVSVGTETVTVSEGAGTISVEVVLSAPAASALTIEYSLGGTATSPADYSIVGREGEVEIAQGATSGTIEIEIVDDAIFEGNETIVITLEDVKGGDATITRDDETVITIEENDQQITLSMETDAVTVNEDDGEISVKVNLSTALTQDVTVNYTLTGSALDAETGIAEEIPLQFWDYFIDVETAGQFVIPQGQTSFEIPLTVLLDFNFEDDETIVITLAEASNGVQISENKTTTITLEQQNGKVIALVWQEDYDDVDMDLFLWDLGDEDQPLLGLSASEGPTPQLELLFVPSIVETLSLGASYVYYSGTEEPMNFEVHFADYVDGTVEDVADRDIFPATYTLANLNPWADEGSPEPAIAQTFEVVNGEVTNVSDPIVVPASGSRVQTMTLPTGLKKYKLADPSMLKKFK